MRQEAERLGLGASDAEVRNAIAGMKAFQTESGGFDKDRYLRVLRGSRLTAGEFEASEREEIVVNKLQDVIAAGVHVGEAEALDRFHFENDKITLKFIKFDSSTFLTEVEATDDELQKHYDANQEQLRDPDKVRIDFVHYVPDKFVDKLNVSDDDLRAYYDAHTSDYEKPEQVAARHILLKVDEAAGEEAKAAVRKKAEALLAKAKAGDDFAALASANSEDEGSATKGGDLGTFGRGAMVKPFEDAAFALNPGEVSDIVESQYGFHIIKVESKVPAHTQPFDEVRTNIGFTVRTEQVRRLAHEQADADHAKVEAGASLSSVAESSGFKMESPEPFAQGDSPAGIGPGPVTKVAFATEAGKLGPVVDAPAGFYVFVVKERIASRVPPLPEVRERVQTAVREKKAEAVAKTKAEAALAALRASGDIDAVAQSLNVSGDETGEFARPGEYISKIGSSPELKTAAFKLTPKERVAPEVYAVSGSSVIAVLKDVSNADEEKFKSDKDNLMRQLEERRKGQALEEFVNYLKARATIELNQDYLAAIPDTGRLLGGETRGRP